MSDKDELAKLKAELAAKDAELAKSKAAPVTMQLAKEPSELEKKLAANAGVRTALKAKTYKNVTHAFYRIPENGSSFYRLGIVYKPGTLVSLPLAEDPSVTWAVVDADEVVKPKRAAAVEVAEPSGERLTDRSL